MGLEWFLDGKDVSYFGGRGIWKGNDILVKLVFEDDAKVGSKQTTLRFKMAVKRGTATNEKTTIVW